MMSNKKTLTKDVLRSLIKERYPELKHIDLFFDALEEVVVRGLDDGYKVKLGKLLTLEPQIKEPRKHYNGVSKINGGQPTYVELPKRIHIKINKLQKLKEIETKRIK